MAPPVVNVHYTIKDGVEDDSYARFIEKLRGHLANHLDDVKYDVEGHPVLPEQRSPRGPARWIYVHLATEDNQRVTLAVRDDNVYLKGFRNKKKRWYEFGIGDKKTVRLLLRSTFLNCEFDYPSLLDGSTYSLKRVVDLRKKKVIEAVRRLSAYEQPPHAGADEATKRDLARLIVIVCESVRMKPHFDRVNNSWRNDPMFATMLTEQQVKYLMNWGNMSQALLEWKLSRDRDG